ncbi:MAG: hypothetical protein VW397_07365 [Candidatus Margulisiibacteriota bacterium]
MKSFAYIVQPISKYNQFTHFQARRFCYSKAIIPYDDSLVPFNLAVSNAPVLNQAIQYLTTAPNLNNTDIIYHVQDFDDRLLDISLYKDFKQNKHFFSIHFNPTDAGIQFYKNVVKRIIKLDSPYKYTYQPHFGKIEIAIEIEPPKIMNHRRIIRPIYFSTMPPSLLEKKLI